MATTEKIVPCDTKKDPRSCWRIRCQLGNVCVALSETVRVTQPVEDTVVFPPVPPPACKVDVFELERRNPLEKP